MTDISKIDKNFAQEVSISTENTVFYDVKENLFCLYGVFYENGSYRRMPEAVAKSVSPAVGLLHKDTAGGRIRFVTDSPFVSLIASMPKRLPLNNMAPTGSSSFDLYVDGKYSSTFIYPMSCSNDTGYESRKTIPCFVWDPAEESKENGATGMHEVTIHFPLYHEVREVRVGLNRGACFLPAPAYRTGKRVIVYGSSITQGGCASRAGLAYSNILAMQHGVDVINLGFSGNAKGEDAMCDYIIQENPDVFLMDYDHNAPTLDHLKKTHERFFHRFRAAHPQTPVIIMTAPNVDYAPSWFKPRRDVIYTTYRNAVAEGDKNVFFIDGRELFGNEGRDLCTTDGTHPNDIGHYRMASVISPILKDLL